MNLRRMLRSLRGGRLLIALLVLAAVVLLVSRIGTDLYIDVLWHGTLGYLDVFWTRTLWQWGIRLVAGLATAALVFFNLRLVASTLGAIQIRRQVGDLEIAEKLPRSYVVWGVAALAALVGLWFAAAIPSGSGLRSLVALRAPTWGTVDPILGHDLSFYVFVLPVIEAVVLFGLVLTFIIAALAGAGYATTGSLGWEEDGLRIGRLPRIHLSALLAAFLVLLAIRFWTGRYGLLQNGNSAVQGIFGYADANARLPGHEALAGLTLFAAAAVLWGGIKNRVAPIVASLVAVVIGGVGLLQVYPALIQRFRVDPNELARESPYIEHNLGFTRMGFGLDRMEQEDFEYAPPTGGLPREEAENQLRGFPIWSEGALLTTYREVEARFRYYQFPHVAIDRYPSPSGIEPVAISVREIDPGSIQDPNWQNRHVRKRYVSGMGAVASSAAERMPEGRPRMLLSAIPPVLSEGPDVPLGLELARPEIYFSSTPQHYAVMNPGEQIFETPAGEPLEVGVDYPPGIRLASPLRTLALAWRFRDANLLFATEVSDRSRFVFRRQVLERVRAVAPFLEYLEAPYPVVDDGRIVWVLEGFTTTANLPLSSRREARVRRSVNYIRNSVKITVDAVTGEVRFWAVREDDPLLEAYARALPGLFRPLDEMPAGLRSHIRYPRSLLELQGDVLRQYHQETPRRFHGQQDVWTRPRELGQQNRSVPYGAEYAYYRLPDERQPGFHLTTVFVPVGRQNLTGFLVARSDPERYGELLLLDVPVEDQVRGPRQVEALVEQDPTISEQFSLWRSGGSQVWTGHLHLIPVGDSFLYMEPVYLAADEDAIPELRRFVLSDGRRVAMTRSLSEGLDLLAGEERPMVADEGVVTETPVAEEPGEAAAEPGPGATPAGGEVPDRALELLDSAERRLRDGDWGGFGRMLEELRSLLERAGTPARPSPDSGRDPLP